MSQLQGTRGPDLLRSRHAASSRALSRLHSKRILPGFVHITPVNSSPPDRTCMASSLLARCASAPLAFRTSANNLSTVRATRQFQSSTRLMETPSQALPTRKPIGAFRGRCVQIDDSVLGLNAVTDSLRAQSIWLPTWLCCFRRRTLLLCVE